MKEQLTELKAALDEAKKDSIEANKQVPITLKETGEVKKELYEKLNERSDIKPAANRFKAAEKKLQAAIEAALKRLRTGLRYTKLKLDKEEIDETLVQKRAAGALPNELQPLAQKKLSFESKIKDMEAKALKDDAEYRKAKDEYDDAQAAYLKARNAHEKTVLEDPELIAAQKKQVDAVKAQKDARVKVSKLTAQYSSARRKAGVLDSQYAAKKKELASLNSRKESLERQAKRYLKDRD
jgi:chromosome segregation ATPase